MTDSFDVIVVGARCAGAPLATLLARQGLQVALVEKASFPRDTLSTHIFQGPAINFLDRLGVLDKVLETGARGYTRVLGRQEELEYEVDVTQRPGDHGAFMSVRRFVLDPLLADAAAEAGATVMMSTNVVGLVREEERVTGVRVSEDGGERVLRARLVVGADGRNSTVAELVEARKYNVTPGERFAYWGFFEDANFGADAPLVYHRWEGRFVIATPADSGLYQVIALPDMRFLPEFRQDRERAFLEHARACEPVAQVIAGARRVGKLLGMLKYRMLLPRGHGAGLGAGRRCRSLQGSGARSGHLRRVPPGAGAGPCDRAYVARA